MALSICFYTHIIIIKSIIFIDIITSSKLQACLLKQPLKTQKKLKEVEIMH